MDDYLTAQEADKILVYSYGLKKTPRNTVKLSFEKFKNETGFNESTKKFEESLRYLRERKLIESSNLTSSFGEYKFNIPVSSFPYIESLKVHDQK